MAGSDPRMASDEKLLPSPDREARRWGSGRTGSGGGREGKEVAAARRTREEGCDEEKGGWDMS